ncbi:unnamed protein product [Jaminaea pallidilutea]
MQLLYEYQTSLCPSRTSYERVVWSCADRMEDSDPSVSVAVLASSPSNDDGLFVLAKVRCALARYIQVAT